MTAQECVKSNRHFQYTADTDVDTYADLKYRGRFSIFSIFGIL